LLYYKRPTGKKQLTLQEDKGNSTKVFTTLFITEMLIKHHMKIDAHHYASVDV
jgi:hypothetical protein